MVFCIEHVEKDNLIKVTQTKSLWICFLCIRMQSVWLSRVCFCLYYVEFDLHYLYIEYTSLICIIFAGYTYRCKWCCFWWKHNTSSFLLYIQFLLARHRGKLIHLILNDMSNYIIRQTVLNLFLVNLFPEIKKKKKIETQIHSTHDVYDSNS